MLGGVAAGGRRVGHNGGVTTKEQLHQLVDELADEQAAHALVLLETVSKSRLAPRSPRRVPSSLGVGASGRGDLSERVDEVLAKDFGR